MTDKLLLQFRVAVYQSLLKRPDAVLDLIDALTVADHVESPVTLSEQTPFRRKFSMVYDTLCHAVIDLDALLHALLDYQPGDGETIGGYKVDPELSDSQVGSQQVKELAGRDPKPKVVVADSLYGNHVFLAIFLLIQNTFGRCSACASAGRATATAPSRCAIQMGISNCRHVTF